MTKLASRLVFLLLFTFSVNIISWAEDPPQEELNPYLFNLMQWREVIPGVKQASIQVFITNEGAGSGTLLDDGVTILTARHVVRLLGDKLDLNNPAPQSVEPGAIVIPSMPDLVVTMVQIQPGEWTTNAGFDGNDTKNLPSKDVALLTTTGFNQDQGLKISEQMPRSLENVVIFGYPLGYPDINMVETIVLYADFNSIVVGSRVYPGNSGGAFVDIHGDILAVVSTGTIDPGTYLTMGAVVSSHVAKGYGLNGRYYLKKL